MAVACHTEQDHLDPRFEKKEEPKLPVVELSNAAANPEAMVIELPHTLATLIAMPAAVGLLYVANLAEAFWWHLHRLNVAHAAWDWLNHGFLFILSRI